MALTLMSTAFIDSGPIPRKYTCQGADVSPPLAWTGVPREAKSLALIVDDLDAPDPAAPKMTWVHWVVYNISPSARGLVEDHKTQGLPAGSSLGRNDWQRTNYGGPCPPVGRHRYFYELYALDCVSKDLKQPDKAQLLRAMQGHVLAERHLIGTYEKS
jgi:Raf kinase inhibitor-like YbhB/YbcL family protein